MALAASACLSPVLAYPSQRSKDSGEDTMIDTSASRTAGINRSAAWAFSLFLAATGAALAQAKVHGHDEAAEAEPT